MKILYLTVLQHFLQLALHLAQFLVSNTHKCQQEVFLVSYFVAKYRYCLRGQMFDFIVYDILLIFELTSQQSQLYLQVIHLFYKHGLICHRRSLCF